MPTFGRNREVIRSRMSLTMAQALIGMVSEGWITEAEGQDWLAGNALPAVAEALIGSLPQSEQFAARARMLRGSVIERSNPLTYALGSLAGLTPEQLDAFFDTYSQI